MYVEAEALGAEINFRENMEFEFPLVRKAGFGSVKELTTEITESTEFYKRGELN